MRQVKKIFSYAVLLAALGASIPSSSLFAMPTNSSPIALTSDNKYVWVVNPNVEAVEPVKHDSVTVHEVGNDVNLKRAEITVGDDPQCVALTPDNKKAYVTNMGSGTVSVIDAQTYYVIKTLTVGSEPFGCAVTPDGTTVYIANFSSDTVSVIRTSDDKVIKTIKEVRLKPRGLAITEDGTKLYVTQFLAQLRAGKTPADEGKDDSKEGRVTVIDTKKNKVIGTITLQPIQVSNFFLARGDTLNRIIFNANDPNTLRPTGAFPNLLASVVIKDDRAYLPGTCSSPNGPVRFNVNVQSCLSVINTTADTEYAQSLNMNDGVNFEPVGKKLFNTNPVAIAFKRNSDEGFIALAATNRLLRVTLDANGVPTINPPQNANDPGNIVRIEMKDPNEIIQPDPDDKIGGKNPRGLVINSTDTRAYVMNLISRDVVVVDISGNDPSKYKAIARILSTALPEPNSLAEIIRRGHQLFNTAIGPTGTGSDADQKNATPPAGRMSDFGWGACYSCHPNGLTDNVTWMFNADGPRSTISMESTFEHPQPATAQLNTFGAPLLPFFHQRLLNYSAPRDEVQDFELNTRNVSGGQGLIRDGQAVVNLNPTANTGRDPDADSIATYIAFGIRAPISPLRGQGQSNLSLKREEDDDDDGNEKERGKKQEGKGRELFAKANCQLCHGGPSWTSSLVDFAPPPVAEPITTGQLTNYLCDVGTFDPNASNEIIAGIANGGQANLNGANGALGFNIPSLLSIFASAPYLHSGACADLECVLDNVKHRSAGTNGADTLHSNGKRKKLIRFLKSIDATTPPFPITARPCQKP